MDNKLLGKINEENASVICAKIAEEADDEILTILEQARKETGKIISGAQKVAEDKKEMINKDAEREIQKSQEKMLSSLNLEKKHLVFAQKDKFIQLVLAEAKKKSEEFRNASAYPEFLESAIVEGIKVIEQNNIEIYYSYLDEHLFNEAFIKNIKSSCFAVMNKDCNVKFNKSDFKDLGVIVNSAGGRMMYDNRFLARMERAKEEIYMELLKESF